MSTQSSPTHRKRLTLSTERRRKLAGELRDIARRLADLGEGTMARQASDRAGRIEAELREHARQDSRDGNRSVHIVAGGS